MTDKEPKFTPGPWWASGQMIFAESKKHPIAAVDGLWLLTGNTFEANAALIAAAPEMYGELESTAKMLDALAELLEDQMQNGYGDDLRLAMLSAVDRMRVHAAVIRELLAGARGEEVKCE